MGLRLNGRSVPWLLQTRKFINITSPRYTAGRPVILNENQLIRYLPNYTNKGDEEVTRRKKLHEPNGPKFHELPLNQNILDGLSTNFAEYKNSTPLQQRIINALMKSGVSFIVRGWNGSGKSFGAMLSTLSMYFEASKSLKHNPVAGKPVQSGCQVLFIVPNDNLAAQYQFWIERLLHGITEKEELQHIYKILTLTPASLDSFQNRPPYIGITTFPNLQHCIKKNQPILKQFTSQLQLLIVDESDLVIPDHGRSRRLSSPEILADKIFLSSFIQLCKKNLRINMDDENVGGMGIHSQLHGKGSIPTMVFMSASNSKNGVNYLSRYITDQLGIIGIDRKHQWYWNLTSTPSVFHYLIKAQAEPKTTKVTLANLPYEFVRFNNSMHSIGDNNFSYNNSEAVLQIFAQSVPRILNIEAKKSKLENNILKCVMIVLPKEFNPHSFCNQYKGFAVGNRFWQCRTLSTESLNFSTNLNNVVFVANPSEIRGLHLPSITHIFHLWSTFSGVAYQHIAGRLGAMGQTGKIFNFIIPDYYKSNDFKKTDFRRCILFMLQRVGIRPKSYEFDDEHF